MLKRFAAELSFVEGDVAGCVKESSDGTVKLTRIVRDYPFDLVTSDCLSAGTRHVVPHQEGTGS